MAIPKPHEITRIEEFEAVLHCITVNPNTSNAWYYDFFMDVITKEDQEWWDQQERSKQCQMIK